MDDREIQSLFEMVDFQNPVYPREEYFDLEEMQRVECGEQRWRENNRDINLRNYENRPEDYR